MDETGAVNPIVRYISYVIIVLFVISLPFVMIIPYGFVAYPIFTFLTAPMLYMLFTIACHSTINRGEPQC